MELSVVIPAYNEQDSVRPVAERCLVALRPLFKDFEVIIVDDKSTDRTGNIADELSHEYPDIRVIHNERNLRQGASLLVGLTQARGEFLTHNAMDYPFHLEDLPQILPMFAHADIVVGARNHRTDSSLYRRVLTAVNLFLLRHCFGLRLKDYNFVQVYRRDILKDIDLSFTSTGFVLPSILFQAHYLGHRIEEVTLQYWPRTAGTASSGRPRVLVETLRDMMRFWVKHRLCGRKGKVRQNPGG